MGQSYLQGFVGRDVRAPRRPCYHADGMSAFRRPRYHADGTSAVPGARAPRMMGSWLQARMRQLDAHGVMRAGIGYGPLEKLPSGQRAQNQAKGFRLSAWRWAPACPWAPASAMARAYPSRSGKAPAYAWAMARA